MNLLPDEVHQSSSILTYLLYAVITVEHVQHHRQCWDFPYAIMNVHRRCTTNTSPMNEAIQHYRTCVLWLKNCSCYSNNVLCYEPRTLIYKYVLVKETPNIVYSLDAIQNIPRCTRTFLFINKH